MKAALAVLCILAVGVMGCATTKMVPGAVADEDGNYVFMAQGESCVAQANDSLSLAEARAAAATTAKANLLGKIKGEIIAGSVTVGDLMFQSQEASAMVQGYLARITISFVEMPTTKLPQQPGLVTATASLTLNQDDVDALAEYVE